MTQIATILKATSHRAIHRLKAKYPDAIAMYHKPTIFEARRGYYYKVIVVEYEPVKGVTVARDQDLSHYGQCW